MGMKSWRTQSSKDDGADAVVDGEAPFFAGVCVIQAMRYSKTVPVEDVRALYGTMHQKKAAVGIVVTTSNTWASTSSSAQAAQCPSLQVNAAVIVMLVPRISRGVYRARPKRTRHRSLRGDLSARTREAAP